MVSGTFLYEDLHPECGPALGSHHGSATVHRESPGSELRSSPLRSHEGTPLDPPNVVERSFQEGLQNAGLPTIRWQDLRHTYASLQLAAGANIKYLSQQMGHASVQITLDRYGRLLRDTHPDQAARLSALVFGRDDSGDLTAK